MRHGLGLIILALPLLFLLPSCKRVETGGGDEAHVYSTWEGMELDKAASIWLIKRHVDRQATFRFYPAGTLVEVGIPFDTPDSEWRRTHQFSTFESILLDQNLDSDPTLVQLATITHDIEVNIWAEMKHPLSRSIQQEFVAIDWDSLDDPDTVDRALDFFDGVYSRLKQN